jgi:hypothetical protein
MARDRVRDEAERLVAAAITAVSLAARGMGAAGRGSNIATGSAECCVCPVCRVIATMRDPSADLADRLAAGAGDLATGVASMLRALSRTTGHPDADDERTREGDEFWESLRRRASAEATAWRTRPGTPQPEESEMDNADPWRAATTAPAKPMAKKAVKKTAAKKVAPPPRAAERPEPAPGPEPTGASAPAARKAPNKGGPAKAAKKAAPAPDAAAPAKKATVAKATKKAVPPPADFG